MLGNETVIASALASGATSTQYNTALMQFAQAAGATADDLPTALYQAFESLGYTGSLSDKYQQWAAAGFPGASTYGYQWTIGQNSTTYGYDVSPAYGNLDPTTAPHGDPDPIVELRVDVANYMYCVVAGSHGGTQVWAVIEGYNDTSTAIVLNGDVGQWYSGPHAGLNTYLAGQVGNTLGLDLYDTNPA